MIRLLSALALLVASLSFVAPVSAQTSTPPDVVRLRDGTFLRGTIVERSPAQVVVMLPTGETRTYPADQVEFAGPDVPAGPAIVQQPVQPFVSAPPSRPMARLHVRTSQEALSLQQLEGTATASVWTGRGVGTVQIDQFGIVCNAPCDVEVPEGTYQLAVAEGTGSAQRVGGPTDLRGDMTLDLGYENRSALRIAGWLTFGLGVAGGTALIVASIFEEYDPLPLLVSGCVIAGASFIAGFILAFLQDAPSIEISSDGVRF